MRIVGGKFRGMRFSLPKNCSIRPTSERVREAIFNILQHGEYSSIKDIRVLDLFSGTGALGLEALSRGASFCLFVEHSALGRSVIRTNIEKLGLQGNSKVFRCDATALGVIGSIAPFDLIFSDPPYGKKLGESSAHSAIRGGWLRADALLVLEEESGSMPKTLDGFKTNEIRIFGNSSVGFFKVGG